MVCADLQQVSLARPVTWGPKYDDDSHKAEAADSSLLHAINGATVLDPMGLLVDGLVPSSLAGGSRV